VVVVAGVLLAGFVVVSLCDGAVYRAVGATVQSRQRLGGVWWYLALRNAGSLWTWLVVGAVLVGVDAVRARGHGPVWVRGVFVAGSAAGAGLCAEVLKLVIGRERPATIEVVDGVEALVYQGYQFRGLFSGFLDGSNLGLPCSHAAVAAGGAFALGLALPARWWGAGLAAVVLAAGCGVTRVLTGAHFAGDVYAGLVLGLMLSVWLGRAMGVRGRGGLGGASG
jgi:membrane-associated phospholipid phosphatase